MSETNKHDFNNDTERSNTAAEETKSIFSRLKAGADKIFHFHYPKVLSIILTILLPIASYYLMETFVHNPFEMNVMMQIMGILFVYLCTGLFSFIFGRVNLGLLLTALLTFILGLAYYYVLEFRGTPILPWDLSSLDTASSVAGNFDYSFTPTMVWIAIGYIVIFLLSLFVGIKFKGAARRGIGTLAIVLSFFVYITLFQNSNFTEWIGVYEMPFTQGYTYKQNGFFVSFIVNTKYLKVETPENYSSEAVLETISSSVLTSTGQTAEQSEDSDKPNIIIIMNEAFSDLSVLGDFAVSEDYIPYLRSLTGSENTITGYLNVSVLGGNTANTEFEVLTGCSMAFLPTGSVPYQQYINTALPALPELLKEQGYQTVAMHPYGSSGWNRDTVYPCLGFDTTYFYNDFDYRTKIRDYISDQSTYRQIIQEYENKEDGVPLFVFDVTMQNHGGYSNDWEGFERTLTVTDRLDLGPLKRVNAYLTLIKESDNALKELLEYFENQDEKTIVVFFGDHQPNVETAFLESLYGKTTDELTISELANRYKVPFLMWANYDIEEQEGIELSANYVSALLMQTAGLEMSDFQAYLAEIAETVPVITANYYQDTEGNVYSIEDTGEYANIFEDYSLIQYNYLFDEDGRLDDYYNIRGAGSSDEAESNTTSDRNDSY